MDAKKFGAFIADVRKEKGMTQAELAAELNVTDKAVSKWERGLGFPDINSLEPLADALGLSVLELMRSERLAAPALEPEAASAALSDAFVLVTLQRRAERKAIIKIVLSVIALILLIFLIDGIDFWVLSFVYMPVICLFAGISLVIYGSHRRRRGLPSFQTLALAVAMLLIFLTVIVLFFLAGSLGLAPAAA